MKRIIYYFITFIQLTCLGVIYAQADMLYNILDFGAVDDENIYSTEAIQKAIDTAAQKGGGTIFFPAGTYLTRSLVLKSNITLHLDNGAILLGSTDLNRFEPDFGAFEDSDGRKFGTALIFANDVENIVITGQGTIDGQGHEIHYPRKEGLARPHILRFIRCTQVKVENINLIHSASWVSHYVECEDVLIRGITIRSYANKNNDGIDLVSCRRVIIDQCHVDTEDDSIVLKTFSHKPCQDIVISNCLIGGLKSAIKIGTESVGDFENITISNCTIYGTRGISLLAVDGASINNVTISNISMRNTYAVIVMRLGARMRPYHLAGQDRPNQPGTFKHIMVSNIQATGVTESNDFICGIPGHPIEEVILSNIRIEYTGGGTIDQFNRIVPELSDEYPKAKMFGALPAYGFFIRHARDVTLRDIHFSIKEADQRPALFCDDVHNLTIDQFHFPVTTRATPAIYFKDVQQVVINNLFPGGKSESLLQVEGEHSQDIFLSSPHIQNLERKVKTDRSKPSIIRIHNP
jgi:polygalacturonase